VKPKFYAMPTAFNERLVSHCEGKNNRLCIGLDLDQDRIPDDYPRSVEGLEKFGKEVIEATIEFTAVYKLNMAFYERHGWAGYAMMERLVEFIDHRAITIADGKRGDIGNTAKHYAHAIFNTLGFDALTVSPYMGRDAIQPFIEDETHGAFVLGLTSNPGAEDFQLKEHDGIPLYLEVAELASSLNRFNNLGLVVGATKPEQMQSIRAAASGLAWLIPGIGAQGGDLKTSVTVGNQTGPGIINVSRGILYAGDGSLDAVRAAALDFTKQIRDVL